jgi:DnaJ-class molecular chaperone
VFEHASDQHPDKSAGHVIFKLNTVPDANFTRKGDDLEMEFHISLLESLVGFEKEFQHLDGHSVQLVRSSVTSPGKT